MSEMNESLSIAAGEAPSLPLASARLPTRLNWLALCVLGLSALTLARAGLAGTARVDGASVGAHQIWLGIAWLALSGLAMRFYLWATESDLEPRHVLWGAILVHAAAALALPYSSNDIFSNLAYGRMLRLGLNPYLAGPSALPAGDPFLALVGGHWVDTPSVYGPVNLVLNWVAGRADTVASAMAVYKLEVFGTSVATVFAAYAICRRHLKGASAASAFAFLALNPLLVYEVSGQAHNDGVMVLGLMLFVWAALEDRELLATAFLSLAFCAKFAVAPVLGLYLVSLLRRAPLKGVLAAAVAAGLSIALFAPFWHGLSTLAGPLTAVSADSTRVTHSYTDVLCTLGDLFGDRCRLWVYRLCWGGGTALLLVLAARAIARVRSVESVLHESLVYLLCYGLIAAPWYLPWYGTWLLPLALVERDARLRRLVALYSGLGVVQWCLNVAVVQAAVVNTVVLARAHRWFRPQRAQGHSREVARPHLPALPHLPHLPALPHLPELPSVGRFEEA